VSRNNHLRGEVFCKEQPLIYLVTAQVVALGKQVMEKHQAYQTGFVMNSESINNRIKVSAIAIQDHIGSCLERLEGYLTIPFKRVLKNLCVFRPQSVNSEQLKANNYPKR
jgi:hypothetical protein